MGALGEVSGRSLGALWELVAVAGILPILCLSNISLAAGHNNCLSLQFVFMPDSFGSGNIAPASFLINNINKGRWMQEEHRIFMQEYEKYGNNCMQIAKVLSIQTTGQIEKHAECFFKQNLKNKFCSRKTISRVPLSQ